MIYAIATKHELYLYAYKELKMTYSASKQTAMMTYKSAIHSKVNSN